MRNISFITIMVVALLVTAPELNAQKSLLKSVAKCDANVLFVIEEMRKAHREDEPDEQRTRLNRAVDTGARVAGSGVGASASSTLGSFLRSSVEKSNSSDGPCAKEVLRLPPTKESLAVKIEMQQKASGGVIGLLSTATNLIAEKEETNSEKPQDIVTERWGALTELEKYLPNPELGPDGACTRFCDPPIKEKREKLYALYHNEAYFYSVRAAFGDAGGDVILSGPERLPDNRAAWRLRVHGASPCALRSASISVGVIPRIVVFLSKEEMIAQKTTTSLSYSSKKLLYSQKSCEYGAQFDAEVKREAALIVNDFESFTVTLIDFSGLEKNIVCEKQKSQSVSGNIDWKNYPVSESYSSKYILKIKDQIGQLNDWAGGNPFQARSGGRLEGTAPPLLLPLACKAVT